MEIIFLIVILLVLLGGLALIFWFLKNRLAVPKNDEQSLLMIQNQIGEITKTLDNKLGESTKSMQSQFDSSSRLIKEITQELTKVGEGQKQVVDVARQLEDLQDILKNPKQRGNLGEYSLELLLQNFFPHNYESQYEFKDGTKVDFIIRIKDKIIPIDSKFSLENYQRISEANDENQKQKLEEAFKSDIKKRIDETAKYIKPEENTMDFAFMFIPSEAIYYDLLVNKIGALKVNTRDLIEYATREKKVIIVSPTSFIAYLQTVLQGLKAMHIEEETKTIIKNVEELRRHLIGYADFSKKIGVHLGTTVNMYNQSQKEFKKIDKDVLRITGKVVGVEPLNLESPENEDGE
ncbi:MAG: DNA recombination protein RmuC [bacterium]|nr:DNA recombination protein RmuC [bacterium]